MNCPACENELSPTTTGGVTVDVCRGGCGGIWFDNYELEKFDEPKESAGEALLDVERKEGLAVDVEKKRNCPKCRDVAMTQHFFSVKNRVAVDECPKCGGHWLDMGELAAIRKLFDTEKERNAAAQKYYDETFGGWFARERAKSAEELARARKVARTFRFICPSYYMPGDQKWGAF